MKKLLFVLLGAFIFLQSGITVKAQEENEIIIEAEEHIVGFAENRRNPLAHGGGYVGGIDNINDGISVNLFDSRRW